MASKLEQNNVGNGASSPVSSDLAVQPVDVKSVVPVDGPVVQVDNSNAEPISSASCSDAASVDEVAASESTPAASAVVSAEQDDAVDKHTLPDFVEPVAIHDTIADQDTGDLETIPDPIEVDAEKNQGEAKDDPSDSVEPEPIHNIKETPSSPAEPTITQDIIAGHCADDSETVMERGAATPTVVNTKDVDVVKEDTAPGSVDCEATHEVEAPEVPKPAHSVPPHLRPNHQSSSILQSRYADLPRAPRNNYANNSFRGFDGREEVARLNAQMMKVRNELDAERKKNLNMRASIEQEVQKTTDATLARLTTELFHKQVKNLTQQGKLEVKERDLLFREAQIEQTEMFLSEGQKHIYRQTNIDGDGVEEGTLSMAEVKREYERRQAELVAQRNLSDREGQLSLRDKALQLREAAQVMREQQYKAIIRGVLEAERGEAAVPDMDAKLDEVADLEYNRGFGAGKAAGRAVADNGAHDRSFLEGYSVARRAEVALNKLKMGTLARDSPELDFLYNASHPHNMFAMGVRAGGMDLGKEATANSAPVQTEKKAMQEQKKAEEPSRRLPPARPTFASELRGPSHMHNGQEVLANSSAASHAVDSVYEGRKVVKYEDVQGDSLIDLY